MSLRKDTVWATIDTFFNQSAGFAFRLVLAHQLMPADFGVLAMANATLAVLQMINDFGISSTIIQKKEERFTLDFLAAAFTAAVLISGTLFALNQILIAPVSATYFRTSEVENLVRVLGFAFLLMPFSSVSQALLMRSRKFSTIAKCRSIAQLFGITAGSVHLYLFRSLWALPVQMLSTQLVTTFLFYAADPWKPRLYWNAQLRRELFGFSGVVFLNNLLVSLAKNLDQLILGRFVGSGALGIYSFSFYLTDTVRTSLMSIMNRVMLVHFSQNQDDIKKLQRDYLETLKWNIDMIVPPMFILIFAGPVIIPGILGKEWSGVSPVLQILAISVIAHAAGGATSTLFVALGKPSLDLRIFVLTTTGIMLPGVLLGSYYWGIVGTAAGVCFTKLISVAVRQLVLRRLISLSLKRYFSLLGKGLFRCIPIALLYIILVVCGVGDSLPVILSWAVTLGLVYGGIFAVNFFKVRSV